VGAALGGRPPARTFGTLRSDFESTFNLMHR
jgi:hypothetical protein